MPVALRPLAETDRAYVVSTWQHNYADAAGVVGAEREAWRVEVGRMLAALLAGGAACVVACDDADPDTIVGWAIASRATKTLHFVYVRAELRGTGIARQLVEAVGPIAAYSLQRANRRRAAPPGWAFRPSFTLGAR